MNTQCPCPNTSCRRHGNCLECRKFHKSVGSPTYCDKINQAKRPVPSGCNLMDYSACAG